jgi:hypothetical protein
VILVDEAQDIGKEHQEILEMLVGAGSKLSLIGDPNQGVYEFDGATGEFLSAYGKRPGVSNKGLTTNYRSVEPIVKLANRLSGRDDEADRKDTAAPHGAYFIPYKESEKESLLEAFRSMLVSIDIPPNSAAVLCRSGKGVEQWRGGEEEQGQGAVREFANAALYRDKLRRYDEAFRYVCSAVVGLLADQHGQLLSRISRDAGTDVKQLRRTLWGFARSSKEGLPAGSLLADTEWHPLLVDRVKKLLAHLDAKMGLKSADNIGNKLAKRDLLHKPLIAVPDLASVVKCSVKVRITGVAQWRDCFKFRSRLHQQDTHTRTLQMIVFLPRRLLILQNRINHFIVFSIFRASPSNARICLRSAIASLVNRPCRRAFWFPFRAPDPGVPPCMRQRLLPCTAGERHGPPQRILAPQRGLACIGPVSGA